MPRGNIIEAIKILNKDLFAKQHTYKTDYKNCENEKIFCNKPFWSSMYLWASTLKRRSQIGIKRYVCNLKTVK